MEENIIEKELKQEEKPEKVGLKVTSSAKKAIIWFIVINILLSGAIYYTSANHQKPIILGNNSVLLFFSPTCPHCKLVEDFIANNSLNSKINITQENVFLPEIASKYNQLADFCKIAKSERGVPMLYYNQTCYLGDVDSINILKQLGGLG